MADMRNKHRLFVTFQHRNGRPGFHWSIMLAPKHENGEEKPIVYDATNTIAPGYESGQWRYRVRNDDLMGYGNFVARILVAKLSPGQAGALEMLLKTVPVVQGDLSWNCVSWVKGALDVLRASGGELSAVVDGDIFEKIGVPLAEESLKAILKRKLVYASLSDIPTKDVRSISSS